MGITGALSATALLGSVPVGANAVATPIAIAQIPLTVALPAHPQVLFAMTNSESMDGTLSGAIMTGSGLARRRSGHGPCQLQLARELHHPRRLYAAAQCR